MSKCADLKGVRPQGVAGRTEWQKDRSRHCRTLQGNSSVGGELGSLIALKMTNDRQE